MVPVETCQGWTPATRQPGGRFERMGAFPAGVMAERDAGPVGPARQSPSSHTPAVIKGHFFLGPRPSRPVADSFGRKPDR